MYNHCHLLLLSFLMIAVVGQQIGEIPTNIVRKENRQMYAENFERARKVMRNKQQVYLTTAKSVDLMADSKRRTSNILKILQNNLSLRKLKSISNFLKVYTIVLYGFPETVFNSKQIFNSNHPPRLIIRDKVDWQLKDIFNSNILTLVFFDIKQQSSREQWLAKLKHFLRGVHLKKLIFIEDTFNQTEDKELFKWLSANGFWQSLLMDSAGNSLTFQHLRGKFLWNLTLEEFLLQSNKWRNLQAFPINCSMASNPPRAYIQYDDQHKVILKGYYGTIISLFARHYNASLKPFILSNLDYYTEWDCVKYITASQVDIYPDEIAASYLLVPHDEPLPRFYYFLKPFQLNLWSIVICSFLYKVLTLSLIHRLQHGSWNGSLQILYATLSILYLPFQLNHIAGGTRRFLELIMILVGFVVANWYLSILSSLLFSRLYFHNINTLQHLVDHNISIMVDDYKQYVLNATNVDSIIMTQLKVVSNEILLQHRRNLDPQYAYYSQYDKIDFYLHQQRFLLHPRMKVLTGIPPINEVMGGIPMRTNWPFQHLLHDFIKRLTESGLCQYIYTKSMEEGILSGYLHYFSTEHHRVESLSMEYFQMPAILLAVGYTFAFACFLIELFVSKRMSKK